MTRNLNDKGFIIVLSSPSGGGKSSLCKALLKADNKLNLSISATTRKPRIGEIEAIDYHFKNMQEFDQLIAQNMFVEYVKIYNNYYGTLKESLEKTLENGMDVLFDIDWQGARSIKSHDPEAITIFILPPSLDVLRDRLKSRGQDDACTIELRMNEAMLEMNHAEEYDYVVVNDKFENSLMEIRSIITTERIKRSQFHKLSMFFQQTE